MGLGNIGEILRVGLMAIAFDATAADGPDFPMPSLGVVKILGLGVIGLGFLLALLAYRLLSKIQSQPNPNRSVLRSIYFFMGFSIVLCGIGFTSQVFDQRRSQEQSEKELNELRAKIDLFVKSRARLSKVKGKIEVPERGHTVGNTFVCAGKVAEEGVHIWQGAGIHIWLAVEVNGSIWPRERPLQVGQDGKWSTEVYEDGLVSKFSLILIAADEVAHVKIEEWLDRGKREGKYEGMNNIEGMVRLNRVDNLRLEDKHQP
jgi:hypothetical protein